MKNIYLLALLLIVSTVLFTGCRPDSRMAKVEPRAEIDPAQNIASGLDYDGNQQDYSYQAENLLPKDLNLVTILFEYDQFKMAPKTLDIMADNAEQLWNHPRSVILIEGHCDERGTEEYNLALGEKRAREVRQYLTKYGIGSDRISIISYGESMPSDYDHGEKAWAKNRRAEFAVLSK